MNTERFDIIGFKKYQAEMLQREKLQNQDGETYNNYIDPSQRVTQKNGVTITEYSIVSSKNGKEYEISFLPPAPQLFYSVKTFNDKGIIKEEVDSVFLGTFNFDYGIYKYYDSQGYLTKEINYNIQLNDVKIKVNNLLEILSNKNFSIGFLSEDTKSVLKKRWFKEKDNIDSAMVLNKIIENFESSNMGIFEKKILNPYNREDVKRISINFDYSKKLWIVTKDFSNFGRVHFVLDANSGVIINNYYEI